MPNLVGLQNDSPALSMEGQAKQNTLTSMQMEALGIARRDVLSTTDFKENRANYVPTMQLESRRVVNKKSIGEDEKSRLEGWNSKIIYTNHIDAH